LKNLLNPFNLKESANLSGLNYYFTATYLSTKYAQVIHNRCI